MDFSLSEEQKMFRSMFEDFSTNEIAPVAEELDHEETPPLEILEKAARQGFLGATLPEDYFGAALDFVSYSLLIEALARECMSVAVMLATHVGLVAMSILAHGTDDQKERFLPPLASGEAIGAFAMTEPDAGSDTTRLQTRALVDGDEYVIDGVKTWVANTGVHGGQMEPLFLVFAEGPEGMTALIVPAGSPGLTIGYREPTLGLRNGPLQHDLPGRLSRSRRQPTRARGRGSANRR